MSAPTITRIKPTSGPTTGGTTVIIIGTNLANPSAVTFGGTAATIISSTSTSVSVTSPANPAGPSRIVVTTAGGTTTQAVNFNYVTIAAPVITSLSPTNGPESGGNIVIIYGSNLLYTTGVTFSTTPATCFTVLSNNQVAALVPAGTGATSVIVSNTSGTSGSLTYTYNAIAAPSVSSVNPASGPAAGGNTVTINGSGFTCATTVSFGSTPASSFTVISNNAISAVVPPGPAAGGSVSVFITGPGGTSAPGTVYSYTATQTPSVTGLTPGSSSVAGGNTVVLAGTNLNGATAVTFSGIPATSFTVNSPNQINAVAPAGTAGTASMVVTSPAGSSTGVNYNYITAPTTTAIFPAAGATAGGDTVNVTGTGLTGTTSVSFGTTPATSFTVVSDNEVDAVTPAHSIGTVPVNISTPGGTDSSQSFTFQQAPVISSITPTAGSINGGTVVTISGAGLFNTQDVFFGPTAATSFTVNSDNSLTATAPAEAAGAVAVTATTTAATSNGVNFTYIPAPTLTSLSPSSGPIAGGNNVTLVGTGFTNASNVFFGTNPAPFTILNDTSISAVAPPGTGTVNVTVATPGGTSGAQPYSYA